MRWILLPLVAMLVVGCSSGEEALTLDEWADTVCDTRDVLGSLAVPTSLSDLDAIEQVAGSIDEAVTRLDAISPPESAREHQRDILRLYRGISSAQRDFIEAATDADAATLSAATTEYQAELERVFGEFDPESITTEVEDALRAAGCDT